MSYALSVAMIKAVLGQDERIRREYRWLIDNTGIHARSMTKHRAELLPENHPNRIEEAKRTAKMKDAEKRWEKAIMLQRDFETRVTRAPGRPDLANWKWHVQ